MLSGFFTTASSFIRPWQEGQTRAADEAISPGLMVAAREAGRRGEQEDLMAILGSSGVSLAPQAAPTPAGAHGARISYFLSRLPM